jgi:two-component system chemotaxis response regulator CheY
LTGASAAGPVPVLVVLPSPPLRHLAVAALREAFRASGREIAAAETGSPFDALWLLARERPALALVALDLPVLSGDELVALLRARPEHRDLPVVAVAPAADADALKRTEASGVAALLTTPFTREAVASALAAAGFGAAAP